MWNWTNRYFSVVKEFYHHMALITRVDSRVSYIKRRTFITTCGKCCGLAGVWIERFGFEPWPGHCTLFLGKTLYSHSASLHPGVSMGTSKLSGKPDETLGITYGRLASHPGGVAILLIASCYGNRDKVRLCGPLGLCVDFDYLIYSNIIKVALYYLFVFLL